MKKNLLVVSVVKLIERKIYFVFKLSVYIPNSEETKLERV